MKMSMMTTPSLKMKMTQISKRDFLTEATEQLSKLDKMKKGISRQRALESARDKIYQLKEQSNISAADKEKFNAPLASVMDELDKIYKVNMVRMTSPHSVEK